MSDGKKFHVNVKTGEMGRCAATIQCPWAKADPENVQHYESMQETFEAFEAAMEDEKFSNTVSKKPERHLSVVKDADGEEKSAAEVKEAPRKSFAEMTPTEQQAEVERRRAEGIAEIKKKYPALEKRVAPKLEDSKVLKAPAENSQNGYLGGHKFIGGKLQDAMDKKRNDLGKGPEDWVNISRDEVATLIREDLKAAVKAGELPSDLGYSVRKNAGRGVDSITIVVGKKEGRKIVPVDDSYRFRKADPERAAVMNHEISHADTRAISNYDRWKDERELERVPTDEAKQVEEYLGHLGNQWAQRDINSQVDYYHSYNDAYVLWKSPWD